MKPGWRQGEAQHCPSDQPGEARSEGNRKASGGACREGWRVRWTKELRQFFKELGVWGIVRRELKDLERALNDPRQGRQKLMELLSPKPIEKFNYGGVVIKYRRYRVYVRGVGFRLAYVVYPNICRIWFDIAEKRDEETYKRLKRRLKAKKH
ncbi:MAG: hypothetical protein GXO09_05085 [Crenarchaeota archaeon]|nr:hypothetical protein [Thermoproteota archaeon]